MSTVSYSGSSCENTRAFNCSVERTESFHIQEMEAGETAKTKDCLNRFLSSDGGSTVNGKMEPTTRLRCSHFDLSREVFDTQQCVQCLCVLHTAIPQSVLKSSVKTQTHNHESSL